MNIAIVGTGYVGLVSGTCFAEMGVNVTCIDVNEEKIQALLNGNIPIYEPGLDEMVLRNNKEGRLHFTTDITTCLNDVDIVFSAVGTPPDEDGSADLKYVLEVARTVGRNMNKYLVLVTKSTVPVGTAKKIKQAIQDELDKRGVSIPFDVASNPEFLKEGAAIKDFMSPDRVVIGVESEKAKEMMTRLYRPMMLNNFRVIFTDIPSAEMIKYAANSMLATRISFMNDIANLCELVGADVNMVRKGIGADTRIGNKFLYPGCGYGGSCFPKDVKALIKTAEKNGYDMRVLKAVEEVNETQKSILYKKLLEYYQNDLKGKKVADNVRVMVVPATQKIFLQCIQKGLAEIFVEAGCAFNTPSCGPCMGGHMGVMAKGEKCVSTTNRNFVGRMGDTEALIYLASPQVAAASAIAGYIANPEKVGKE